MVTEGKSVKKALLELEAYSEEYKAQRFAMREIKMKAEAEAKGKGRGRGARGKARGTPPPPLGVPAGELEQPQLKPLVPPGASIWRSNTGFAWCGHMPPFKRDSASWHLYGHREAALLVLRNLWRKYLLQHGLSESECPITGLFQTNVEAAVAVLPSSLVT